MNLAILTTVTDSQVERPWPTLQAEESSSSPRTCILAHSPDSTMRDCLDLTFAEYIILIDRVK